METKNTTTERIELDVVTLSLCAARPILGDQLAAVQGTRVSAPVGVGSARVLGGVPSIKAGLSGIAGGMRPMRDRASVTPTPKFADGVNRSASWRPVV